MKTKLFRVLPSVWCAGVFLFVSCAAPVVASKPYTKDVCAVTDNRLGSMGRPVVKVYGDQEVKFCCKPCVAKFEKDPAKYLKRIGS